ncbi:unnamed protein product, partial [Nesidiocoris tenuis]
MVKVGFLIFFGVVGATLAYPLAYDYVDNGQQGTDNGGHDLDFVGRQDPLGPVFGAIGTALVPAINAILGPILTNIATGISNAFTNSSRLPQRRRPTLPRRRPNRAEHSRISKASHPSTANPHSSCASPAPTSPFTCILIPKKTVYLPSARTPPSSPSTSPNSTPMRANRTTMASPSSRPISQTPSPRRPPTASGTGSRGPRVKRCTPEIGICRSLIGRANEKSGQPKWTELESADREAVLKELTPFLGEVVGPVFITLSNKMEL